MDVLGGEVAVLEFDTGNCWFVRQRMTESTGHSYSSPAWVDSDVLAFAESWVASDGGAKPRVALRVMSASTGRTRLFTSDAEQAALSPLGKAADGRWVAFDMTSRAARYVDPISAQPQEQIVSVDGNVLVATSGSFPWIASLEDASVGYGLPTTLRLQNLQSGESRSISEFPRPSAFGVVISEGARWILSATFDEQYGWIPVVFDTLTSRGSQLPPEESWVPVSMSRARGVLLALLFDPSDPDNRRWVEIPLSTVLPE